MCREHGCNGKSHLNWEHIEHHRPATRILISVRVEISTPGCIYFAQKKFFSWREKIWKGVFLCECRDESFTLYEHKGLNYSIFQNNSQIAAFTKNRVRIGNGDSYEIRLNDDADLVVVICLALSVDASENQDDTASVTFEFGNIGPEDRPFEKIVGP
jgi:hypothetical protein